jgi:hypothetical protein
MNEKARIAEERIEPTTNGVLSPLTVLFSSLRTWKRRNE